MSITSAFSNARSGLAASEAWADVTTTNIANASRAGYARRSVPLTSMGTGGVTITGYQRATDAALDNANRRESARVETQAARAEALEIYTTTLGDIDSTDGLPGRVTDFQVQLDSLAVTPADATRQQSVLRAAQSLASTLRAANDTLERTEDALNQAVQQDVVDLNDRLERIAEINRDIAGTRPGSVQRATFEDQLGENLDSLSQLMEVTVQTSTDGRISIYTTGGAALIENNRRHEVAFSSAERKLSVNGIDITPGETGARGSQEGALAGRLQVLGKDLPRMRGQLDAMATQLVTAFSDPDVDETLTNGAQGLFVDTSFGTEGAAGRIAVNARVDPEQGGALWRLRDGVGADGAGASGGNAQINRFSDALSEEFDFAGVEGLSGMRSIGDFAAALVSEHQLVRNDAMWSAETLSAGRNAVEASRQAIQGVNVDDELQQLMLIEQSYAANATVMKTLDEMMDSLLNAFR